MTKVKVLNLPQNMHKIILLAFIALLFPIQTEAYTDKYIFVYPNGETTFHEKIDTLCRWRGCNAEQLKRVMFCESSNNPNAYNYYSGASGLFQYMPSTWSWFSELAGVPGANVWNPDAQLYVTSWAFAKGLEHHWVCK